MALYYKYYLNNISCGVFFVFVISYFFFML